MTMLGHLAGRTVAGPALVLTLLSNFACLPRSDKPFERQTDDDAGGPDPVMVDPDDFDDLRDLPDAAPHAVLSVSPNHGPFTGGQTVLVRGNGFGSEVQVWFGSELVPEDDVVAVDPNRVQVVTPPGTPGPVSISTQNAGDRSTRASLPSAYIYDAFYVEPASGPISGGTTISIVGSGTEWDEDTEVLIDLMPCENVVIVSETELTCTTPAGTQGAKNVRVVTADGVETDVLDAFIYGDSETGGFRGGLSGQPLESELTVTVLDDITGSAIPGATVIVGASLASAQIETTNGSGVVRLSGDLGPTQTISVAAKCFSPITFVDVPVDTVNVYLVPVLDISCADFSDIPPLPGGASGSSGSTVRGELLWAGRSEFDRSGWTNVPAPAGQDERLVAYVFAASSSATREFRLPSPSAAVTPTAAGNVGYNFYLGALPGNATYYALAGIENRKLSPPVFTPYAMGVAEGVTTQPDTTTSDVFIPIDVPLDHTLSLEVTPPQSTPRGPDRVQASVVVRLSEAGYAILPTSHQTRLLPGSGRFDFVGVPPLAGSLTGAQYVTFAEAVTGEQNSLPNSFGGLFSTTVSNEILTLDEFVEIPVLESPPRGSRWDGESLVVSWAAGGVPVDLTVFHIESSGGLTSWTIAAPAGVRDIRVPDLREVSSEIALAPGALTILVTAAQIVDFDYGSLRYRQLQPRGFNAFARDVFQANY